jgi:sec-independent protein translocase protein TatB
MPTIGWFEILIVVAIAIVVLGPKDFPIMLKKVGSWIGSAKKYVNNIQNEVSNIDLEDLKSNNILVLGVEGQDTSDWILIDCEDLVINIMNNETRVYYDLETLWGYEDATLNSNL